MDGSHCMEELNEGKESLELECGILMNSVEYLDCEPQGSVKSLVRVSHPSVR